MVHRATRRSAFERRYHDGLIGHARLRSIIAGREQATALVGDQAANMMRMAIYHYRPRYHSMADPCARGLCRG